MDKSPDKSADKSQVSSKRFVPQKSKPRTGSIIKDFKHSQTIAQKRRQTIMPGKNKVMALDLSAKDETPVESDREDDDSSEVSEQNSQRSSKSFKYE